MSDKNREVIIENSLEINEESTNKKGIGISPFQSKYNNNNYIYCFR